MTTPNGTTPGTAARLRADDGPRAARRGASRLAPALVVTLALVALATGCRAPAGPPPVPDAEDAHYRLMEADRTMFANYSTSGDSVSALMGWFLDDATVMAPGAPRARGKAAARAVFEGLEERPAFSLTWAPDSATLSASGDLGYTMGRYRMTVRGEDGEDVVTDGKYLTVWHRQTDGAWRVAVDMFNDDGES